MYGYVHLRNVTYKQKGFIMDSKIFQRYNDNILQEAIRRYGIPKNSIKAIDTFENFIYEYEREGKSYILRIGHSMRKSEALIQGEVDWINYLARGGVSVARAIPSQNGKLVEAIDDNQGGQFFTTAFSRAEGQQPWLAGWSTEKYKSYGELIGKMHALALEYQPNPAWKRPEWDEDSSNLIEQYLPATEVGAHREYKSLLQHIRSLPKEKNYYGLIHQDAHQNNFFIDSNGIITLFDFDECAYSWFINDIAIVLFYISMDAEEFGYPSLASFTTEFMVHFLKGYSLAFTVEPSWLKEIPTFLKLREIELYAVVHRDFDIKNVNHSSIEEFIHTPGFDVNNSGHMWIATFMQGRKQRIEQGIPFIDYDFESLAEI